MVFTIVSGDDYLLFIEDNNARNGRREKKRKAETNMGEIHHIIYVWYDDSGKQSGGGQTTIPRIHLGSDVLKRICSEKKSITYMTLLIETYINSAWFP